MGDHVRNHGAHSRTPHRPRIANQLRTGGAGKCEQLGRRSLNGGQSQVDRAADERIIRMPMEQVWCGSVLPGARPSPSERQAAKSSLVARRGNHSIEALPGRPVGRFVRKSAPASRSAGRGYSRAHGGPPGDDDAVLGSVADQAAPPDSPFDRDPLDYGGEHSLLVPDAQLTTAPRSM